MENVPNYWLSLAGFRSRKAAQICAFFAVQQTKKNTRGTIEKLKLIKLVYLSERKFLEETNFPMLFDEFYSLPHGPVCSSTLNGVNGRIDEKVWGEFIAGNGNLIVALKDFKRDDFDEISDAEIDVLTKIWTTYGKYTASQLRNYTHENCPEYTEIAKGHIPISYKEVFHALKKKNAEQLDNDINSYRKAEATLAF